MPFHPHRHCSPGCSSRSSGFSAFSSAETVGLYFDPATPQIAFAAGDIKAALEKRKHTVETHDLAALAKAGAGKKIVLAVATDKTAASMLSAQGGKPAAGLGPQAYALRTTTAPDMSYWVLGGDANGAMYGGLQLAENIQFHDLARAYDEEEVSPSQKPWHQVQPPVGQGIAHLFLRLPGHLAQAGRQGCLGHGILEDLVRRDGPAPLQRVVALVSPPIHLHGQYGGRVSRHRHPWCDRLR